MATAQAVTQAVATAIASQNGEALAASLPLGQGDTTALLAQLSSLILHTHPTLSLILPTHHTHSPPPILI